jgi:GntR family transcriptional regulator
VAKAPPAYAVLARELRTAIKTGRYRPGQQLPTELTLTRTHGCSRYTVRSALEQLVDEGLIMREVGRGTFVAPSARSGAGVRVIGDEALVFGQAVELPLEIIEPLDRLADPDAARQLRSNSSSVARVVYARRSGGHPIGLWTIWITDEAYDAVQGSSDEWEGSTITIIEVIERATDREAHRAEQLMSAEKASDEVAAMLEVEPGTALLRVERTYYDARDQPLEFLIVRYVPDYFAYKLELLRQSGTRRRQRGVGG